MTGLLAAGPFILAPFGDTCVPEYAPGHDLPDIIGMPSKLCQPILHQCGLHLQLSVLWMLFGVPCVLLLARV